MLKNKKLLNLISFLLLILCIFFIIALMVGKYTISFFDFFKAIFLRGDVLPIQRSIILNLRLPRTIMAVSTGIGLSLSGLLYQEVFQNKLTSPDLLGVSSGASVGAAIAIIFNLSNFYISIFSFVMGIGTVFLTVIVSKLFDDTSHISLILAGIIVSGFMSAILSLFKYFADPMTTLATISYWLMGSFENATMLQNWLVMVIVIICTIISLLLSFRINIVALGEKEAQIKGINYKFYKIIILGIATLLTAISVAFNGIISWIGLVVPHLVRLMVGRDTRNSIPLTIICGGIFMLIVDICARTFTAQEIPLSAITGLIGTVIFIIIVFCKKRRYYVN